MNKAYFFVLFLIFPLFLSAAFAHQSDSVGDYRIEIDWKNKPIVTGESNSIIVYVSEMDKSKEAADQPFIPEKGTSFKSPSEVILSFGKIASMPASRSSLAVAVPTA